MKAKKTNVKKHQISGETTVRVRNMGSVVDIQYSSMRGKGASVKRIDKEHYINVETGEVSDYEEKETKFRIQNVGSVRRSMQKAYEIVNSNYIDNEHTSWLTLRLEKTITDVKIFGSTFQKDFKNFMEKIRRIDPYVKYFYAIEPSANGTFHVHCLLFWSIEAHKLNPKIWIYGDCYVCDLKKKIVINNIGAYLCSYLSDLPFDEFDKLHPGVTLSAKDLKTVWCVNEEGDFKMKKIVKNARLALFPKGFKFYRHSEGMKVAETEYKKYEEARSDILSKKYKMTFNSDVDFRLDEGGTVNIIYETYTKK